MVILSCSHYVNLNCIKSYNRKQKMFHIHFFYSFVKQKAENLCPINGHFKTISCHVFANCINFFHKTENQMVILRCLTCLNLNWIKSYCILLAKIIYFFSCLKIHNFRGVLPKLVLPPQKETISHTCKMAIFSKFFGDSK